MAIILAASFTFTAQLYQTIFEKQQGSSKHNGVNKEGIKAQNICGLQPTFLPSLRVTSHRYTSLEQQTTFLLLKFVVKFSFTAEFTTISTI